MQAPAVDPASWLFQANVHGTDNPLPPSSGPVSDTWSTLVTFVIVILVLYLVNMLPIDGRAKHIVGAIVIIIGIISLLKYLTVL
jgi:hypothetical protein